MKINPKDGWVATELTSATKTLRGYSKKGAKFSDDYRFMKEYLSEAHFTLGILVRREHDLLLHDLPADPWGNKIRSVVPARSELWFFPDLRFEESLTLLDIFSFPNSRLLHEPEFLRTASKRVLTDLAKSRNLALVNFTSDSIFGEILNGPCFGSDEIENLLRFNETHFGIKYADAERADLKKQYVKDGVFVLGRV